MRGGPTSETAVLIGFQFADWPPAIRKKLPFCADVSLLSHRCEPGRGCGNKMAGKRNVLSSLAVYAEDSEPESDGEAGVEAVGGAAGEARMETWKGESGRNNAPLS